MSYVDIFHAIFWSLFMMMGFVSIYEQIKAISNVQTIDNYAVKRRTFRHEVLLIVFALVVIEILRFFHHYADHSDINELWMLVNLQLGVFAHVNIDLKSNTGVIIFLLGTGLIMLSYATFTATSMLAMLLIIIIIFCYHNYFKDIVTSVTGNLTVLVLFGLVMWGTIKIFYRISWPMFIAQFSYFLLIQISIKFNNSLLSSRNERETQLIFKTRHDTLTSTQNLVALHSDFVNYFNQLAESTNISLVMIDIDHFKEINDSYGHLLGDQVLITVTKTIKTTCKKYNQKSEMYRTGGEEFVIIFPDNNKNKAFEIMQHCQETVRQNEIKVTNDEVLHIKFSGGITEIFADEDSVSNVIKRADELLYESKNHGRNQISLSTTPD